MTRKAVGFMVVLFGLTCSPGFVTAQEMDEPIERPMPEGMEEGQDMEGDELQMEIDEPESTQAVDEAWQTPLIEGYGKVRGFPNAQAQPSPEIDYNLVFDVCRASPRPADLNPGLERVARAVNLFGVAGVPMRRLDVVVVVHGGATAAVLNDARYRMEYDIDNPNIDLLAKLREAGVDLFVCGQTLAHHGFSEAWVVPHVQTALGALPALVLYQRLGYALIPQCAAGGGPMMRGGRGPGRGAGRMGGARSGGS